MPIEIRTEDHDLAQEGQQYERVPLHQSSPEFDPALPSSDMPEALEWSERETDAAAPAILDLKTACGFTSISRCLEANTDAEQAQTLSVNKVRRSRSPSLNQRRDTATEPSKQVSDQMADAILEPERGISTALKQDEMQHDSDIGCLYHDKQIPNAEASAPSGSGEDGLAVGEKGLTVQPAPKETLQDVQAM